MARKQAFEELVLAERDKQRKAFGAALSNERGMMPFGKAISEEEQDRQWAYARPELRDPQAFAMLTLPKEQGGGGMTPLRASYTKYPYREELVQGAGSGIEDQIAYAEKRRTRMLERQASIPATPPTGEVVQTQQSAGMTRPGAYPQANEAPQQAPAPVGAAPVDPMALDRTMGGA